MERPLETTNISMGEACRGQGRQRLHYVRGTGAGMCASDIRIVPVLKGIDPLLDVFGLLFVSGDEQTVEQLLPRSRRTRTLIVITHGAAGSSARTRK